MTVRARGRPANILQDVIRHGFELLQRAETPPAPGGGCDAAEQGAGARQGQEEKGSRQGCPLPGGGGNHGHGRILFDFERGRAVRKTDYALSVLINPENVFDDINQNW